MEKQIEVGREYRYIIENSNKKKATAIVRADIIRHYSHTSVPHAIVTVLEVDSDDSETKSILMLQKIGTQLDAPVTKLEEL